MITRHITVRACNAWNSSVRWLHGTKAAAAAMILVFAVSAPAWSNPTGGTVVRGSASINGAQGKVTIDQSSSRAVINWQGFSIDVGELTQFNQPDKSAIALNRVIGSDLSAISGQLKANGNVWLVNPNGVVFGPGARVDVHGLVASTADIANEDFMAGRYEFSIPSPNADAAIINQGTISLGEYGLGGLVAPHVRNDGVITGRFSQVVLAGTPTFALDFHGDGLIQFTSTSEVSKEIEDARALVENTGTIAAPGGHVLLTASAAVGVVEHAINTTGVVEAKSFTAEGGTIALLGGDAGAVTVAGTLDASSAAPTGQGGNIKVLGHEVVVAPGARIDASGDAGGGEVLVGGNFAGAGPEPNASRTLVAQGATIRADAHDNGDGGRIAIWANEAASVRGTLSATGGRHSGDGGFIETSARLSLSIAADVDASAAIGANGTWLIDPENIIIDNELAASISGSLNDSTDVTLSTFNPEVSEAGDIVMLAGVEISKSSGAEATLTLAATTDIELSGRIVSESSALNVILNADADGNSIGAIELRGAVIDSNGGDIVMGGGADPQNEPAFGHGASIEIFDYAIEDFTSLDVAPAPQGVLIANNSVVNAAGGDISIRGHGVTSQDVSPAAGIALSDSTIETTGSGTIYLDGTGGSTGTGNSATVYKAGIDMYHSDVRSVDGDIDLVGAGGNSESGRNAGIIAESMEVISTGIGDITLNGYGGSGGTDTTGIHLQSSSVKSANGSLYLDGYGGSGGSSSNAGIEALNTTMASTGAGDVALYGYGGSGGTNTTGLYLDGSSVESANGSIYLDGYGGFGGSSSNAGMLAIASTIDTGSDATLRGTPGGRFVDECCFVPDPDAIFLDAGSSLRASGTTTLSGGDLGDGQSGEEVYGSGELGDVSLYGPNDINTVTITDALDVTIIDVDDITLGPTKIYGNLAVTAGGSINVIGAVDTDPRSLPAQSGSDSTLPNSITLDSGGTVTLAAGLHTFEGPIVIAGDRFINNAGLSGLNAEGDRYLVYSSDPANDTRGIANGLFTKRYDLPYNPADPEGIQAGLGPGDFFLYDIAPTLSIAADAQDRPYGSPNPDLTFTVSGLIDGDVLDDALSEEPIPTTAADERSDVGIYEIVVGPPTLSPLLGYQLVLEDGELTVTPFDGLTATGVDTSREYGEDNQFDATFTGFLFEDDKSSLGEISFQSDASADSPVAGNPYSFEVVGFDSQNYALAESIPGVLNITPAPLTAIGIDSARDYGDENQLDASFIGLKLGQEKAVLGALEFQTDAAPPSPVAGNPYLFEVLGFEATNYSLTASVPGELTVTPAPLSATVSDSTRLYGGSNQFDASFTGFKLGQDQSTLGEIAYATTARANSPVVDGPYPVEVTGFDNTNYRLASSSVGALTIDPAPLTVTADDASRFFLQPNPPFSASFSGFVLGENQSIVSELAVTTSAEQDSIPGIYALVPFIEPLANYVTSFVDGMLTIVEAPLEENSNELKPDVPIEKKFAADVAGELLQPSEQVYSVPSTLRRIDSDLLFSNDGNRALWNLSIGGVTSGVQ